MKKTVNTIGRSEMGTLRLSSFRAVDESHLCSKFCISVKMLYTMSQTFFLLSLEHSLACEFNETRTVICGRLKYLWCDHLAFLGLNIRSVWCCLLFPSVPIVTLASLLSLKAPSISVKCEKAALWAGLLPFCIWVLFDSAEWNRVDFCSEF